MFNTQPSETEAGLNDTIAALQDKLLSIDPFTDEFDRSLAQLEKLYQIRDKNQPDRVSKDTLLAVGGNLAGILMILNFERLHVVTSKALSFVIKTRV